MSLHVQYHEERLADAGMVLHLHSSQRKLLLKSLRLKVIKPIIRISPHIVRKRVTPVYIIRMDHGSATSVIVFLEVFQPPINVIIIITIITMIDFVTDEVNNV